MIVNPYVFSRQSLYRYSMLNQGDGYEADMENAVHNHTSLYDDEEDVSIQ